MTPKPRRTAKPEALHAPEQIASLAATLSGATSLAQANLAEVADLMGAALASAYVNASKKPFDGQRFAVMLECAMDTAAELHQRIARAGEGAAAS